MCQPWRMAIESRSSAAARELREVRAVTEWVRAELFGIREGGSRATATTAVAAAAAAEAYRVIGEQDEWNNQTSAEWSEHLDAVWAFLGGDASQHYTLSKAIADFLLSPLNHNEGQDGPDDFDRPQTVASYSAALSAITWGVGFAETAVAQIFECIDLTYGPEYHSNRSADVEREIAFVRRIVTTVVTALTEAKSHLDAAVIQAIKR